MKQFLFFNMYRNPIRVSIAIGFLILSGLFNSDLYGQNNIWVAPKSADQLKNPFKSSSTAVAEGKKIYQQLCTVCHGPKGKGDGVAGMTLKPRPANFTKDIVQDQSDGAIYWKVTEGRAPMAPYKAALTEEQRWQLVNYIRTFK